MNAFEKVIGYETVKNELMQICDMVHNKQRYEALGARNILIQNREFLEKIADALVEKETLLYSDIKAIRESVEIKRCVA